MKTLLIVDDEEEILSLHEMGDVPIADVTADVIESYVARRRDEGKSKGTRNRELAIFKAVLKKAREWGYVAHNAAADVTTEREGKKQPQPFTRDEIARLLAEPRHCDIMTLLHTGLRRGEMVKLRWADIDFEARTLAVRAPKNDDDRTIPLSNDAIEILSNRDRFRRIREGRNEVGVYIEKRGKRRWLSLRSGLNQGASCAA